MTAVARRVERPLASGSPLRRQVRKFTAISGMTLFAIAVVTTFLMPLAFMTSTAFKDKIQLTTPGAPLYPASPETFAWQGAEYPFYDVPLPDGQVRPLA